MIFMNSNEHNWLLSHPDLDSQYQGEYLAIVQDTLVAHGKELKRVLQKARKISKHPYIYKANSSDKLVVV